MVKDPVHIRDFQATTLNRFGIDDQRFTFKFQGLDQKLTGTEKRAIVVKDILVLRLIEKFSYDAFRHVAKSETRSIHQLQGLLADPSRRLVSISI